MARRTLRVAVGIVVALVLVVALAVAAAVWLVSTGAGARLVLARVGQLMPGRVELGTVEGSLRGPLRLENVVYTRNGMRLEIAELVLRWELRALLRRQVDVHQLAVSGVRLHTTPGEESDAPFELPQIDLPVNLVVRQASLRDAMVTVGGGEPIRIRSADLATSTRGETVVIETFDLDSPDLALEVSGSLTPLGAYAVDLEIAWDFRAPDGKRYRGAGTLDGTLEDLVVRQRLVEPVAVRVEARLLDPLDDLRFEAGLEAAAVELTAIDEGWPASEVSADLVVAGTLDALEVRGEVLARSEDYGTFRAELAVEGGGERWRIERLRLLPERGAGTMLVRGEVVLGDPARFDLQAEWENLRWPLGASTAEATALAPSGSLAIEGTTEEYRLASRAGVGLPGLLAGEAKAPLWIDADLVAVGDRGGARIERLEGAALGGRITGEGDVSWEPAVAWSLDLRLEDVEPGRIEPRLEGAVDLAVSTEGTMTEGGPRGVVTLSEVAGTLEGEPVRGQGRVELRGEEYGIPELRLAWADAEIEASGVVGETVDLRFSLNAPHLRRLLAGLEGSLAVAGAVTGTRSSPGLEATVSGRSLVLGDFSAAEIAGNAVAGPGPRDPFEIALVAETLSYGELAFASARVTANGTRADHSLEAELAGGSPPIERVELAARGGLVERQWSGTVAQLVFVPEETQVWTLASPAAIAAGPELVRLDGVCLSSSGQRVCATAAWRGPEDWTLEASAADVSLARVGRFYREDLDLEGIVDATVSAAATAGGGVRGSAVATAEEGSFVLPGETELAGRRFFRGASVRAVAGADGTRADAEVELVDVGPLEGFLELPGWSTLAMPPPEEPLRGAFVARASSLEPLVLVSDAFARPRGRLEADLEVAGTVGEPRLEGSARLTEASAFVVPLGITIEDVELVAEPNAAGELVLAGSLRSGDGILTIRGRAPLESGGTMARVELSGQNVVVMDLPDRRVLASTDELTVAWLAERIEAFGDVRIPQATIQLGTDDPDAVTPSRDVVFVRLPPGSERAPQDEIDLYARVRLLFGEEVRVSGFGLETGVRGSLLVIEEPGRFTRATGELDLAGGTFAAYGARLEIERGRLVFAESAVTRPAIDLRAFRRARSVLVGIEARGTLEQPRVTLWSEPAMPQAEQLSYLVLGRPLGEAGQQEGDVLTRAAGSLGLRGGRHLAERLGSLFGLEEARIETGEGGFEEASLVLGKFLSPRLYMAYGVGLFEEGANSILVRYLLSEKLTLEALTGKSTRADVLYVIETGPGEPRPALKPGLADFDR